jgi:hypothetical protein
MEPTLTVLYTVADFLVFCCRATEVGLIGHPSWNWLAFLRVCVLRLNLALEASDIPDPLPMAEVGVLVYGDIPSWFDGDESLQSKETRSALSLMRDALERETQKWLEQEEPDVSTMEQENDNDDDKNPVETFFKENMHFKMWDTDFFDRKHVKEMVAKVGGARLWETVFATVCFANSCVRDWTGAMTPEQYFTGRMTTYFKKPRQQN